MTRDLVPFFSLLSLLALGCGDSGGSGGDGGTDADTDGDTDTDADSDADYVGSIGEAVYLGPWGGAFTEVVEDPTTQGRLAAIVGADFDTGMYASEDDGETWVEVAVPTDLSTTSLLFLDTGRLVVGTDFEVLVTDDFGTTWDDIRENIEEGSGFGITVKGLAYEEGTPGRLWAALGGSYSTAPIWSLADGDTDWTPWNAPAGWDADPLNGAAYFTSLATRYDAGSGETLIFAAYEQSFSAGGGVFCSTDSGATWADCSSGLPNVPYHRVILGEAEAVVAGGHVFGSAFAGIWYSTDDGAMWIDSTDEIDDAIANDVVKLSGGDYLAATYGAGLWRTTALDAAWTQVSGFGEMSMNSVAELASGELLAGPEQLGAYRSEDGGATWQVSAEGMNRVTPVYAGLDPADADTAIISINSMNSGLGLITSNGVDGWHPVPGLPLPRFTFVDIAPSGRWYAVSDGPSTVANDGIYVSDDGGVTFDFIGPLEESLMDHVGIIVVELGGPDHLVAAGNYFTVENDGDPWAFVAESEDAGETWIFGWEGAGTNGSYSMADFVALSDGSYLLAVSGSPIVHLSETFEETVIAIPDQAGFAVTDLAACAADPEVWYARGLDVSWNVFVYKTMDGGATWTDVTPPAADAGAVIAVDVHPYDRDLVFAAAANGFFASADGGTTWAAHDIGSEVSASALRVIPLAEDLAAALLVYGSGGLTRVSLATAAE
ncbi:MAG: glycoside hydrolase [Proteobacteria bacterium]|jgi:photosystem II stability/assembly factor-like uncharacterized protein|nr:glycoside hydrolase [Pseudomonadota bacterium]